MVSTSAEEGFIVQKLKLLQEARAKEARTWELGDSTESTSVFIGNSIKTSGFIQHCIDVLHNNSSVNTSTTSNRHVVNLLVSDSSSLSRPPPLLSIYKDQIERLKTDSSLYRMEEIIQEMVLDQTNLCSKCKEIYVQTLQKEYVRKKRQLLTSPLTRDRLDKHLETHIGTLLVADIIRNGVMGSVSPHDIRNELTKKSNIFKKGE